MPSEPSSESKSVADSVPITERSTARSRIRKLANKAYTILKDHGCKVSYVLSDVSNSRYLMVGGIKVRFSDHPAGSHAADIEVGHHPAAQFTTAVEAAAEVLRRLGIEPSKKLRKRIDRAQQPDVESQS